jgi:hypothetical protein
MRVAELAFREERPGVVQAILQSTQDLRCAAGELVLRSILGRKGFELDFPVGDGNEADVGQQPPIADRAEAIQEIEEEQVVAVGEFEVPIDGIGCKIERGVRLSMRVIDAPTPTCVGIEPVSGLNPQYGGI